jgi:hypothetical protein
MEEIRSMVEDKSQCVVIGDCLEATCCRRFLTEGIFVEPPRRHVAFGAGGGKSKASARNCPDQGEVDIGRSQILGSEARAELAHDR